MCLPQVIFYSDILCLNADDDISLLKPLQGGNTETAAMQDMRPVKFDCGAFIAFSSFFLPNVTSRFVWLFMCLDYFLLPLQGERPALPQKTYPVCITIPNQQEKPWMWHPLIDSGKF